MNVLVIYRFVKSHIPQPHHLSPMQNGTAQKRIAFSRIKHIYTYTLTKTIKWQRTYWFCVCVCTVWLQVQPQQLYAKWFENLQGNFFLCTHFQNRFMVSTDTRISSIYRYNFNVKKQSRLGIKRFHFVLTTVSVPLRWFMILVPNFSFSRY